MCRERLVGKFPPPSWRRRKVRLRRRSPCRPSYGRRGGTGKIPSSSEAERGAPDAPPAPLSMPSRAGASGPATADRWIRLFPALELGFARRFPDALDEIEHLARDIETELTGIAAIFVTRSDPAPTFFRRYVEKVQPGGQPGGRSEFGKSVALDLLAETQIQHARHAATTAIGRVSPRPAGTASPRANSLAEFTCPGRRQRQDLLVAQAVGTVCPGQVAQADQEFADDFSAGEAESPAEEFHPLGLVARVMGIEPGGERTMRLADLLQPPGILDRGGDLEPVADDPGIAQQPRHLVRPVGCDRIDIEPVIGDAKSRTLLEDGEPRQAGLVDLEHQPLEQHRIRTLREAVLGVVIGSVEDMARCRQAIGSAQFGTGLKLIQSEITIR